MSAGNFQTTLVDIYFYPCRDHLIETSKSLGKIIVIKASNQCIRCIGRRVLSSGFFNMYSKLSVENKATHANFYLSVHIFMWCFLSCRVFGPCILNYVFSSPLKLFPWLLKLFGKHVELA